MFECVVSQVNYLFKCRQFNSLTGCKTVHIGLWIEFILNDITNIERTLNATK